MTGHVRDRQATQRVRRPRTWQCGGRPPLPPSGAEPRRSLRFTPRFALRPDRPNDRPELAAACARVPFLEAFGPAFGPAFGESEKKSVNAGKVCSAHLIREQVLNYTGNTDARGARGARGKARGTAGQPLGQPARGAGISPQPPSECMNSGSGRGAIVVPTPRLGQGELGGGGAPY